jgi:hypothetical protein
VAEKIKVDIAASYDDKDAKKALADAEKIDGLKPEMEISADVDRALAAFDEVVAETKRVQVAADALSQALGPELTAKADPTAIVQDLQKMGLTLDDITANADKLGNKLKEVSDTDVGGKLGANLGTTRGKLDEVNKSAESSRSALANMVGNSAQDMGALGGIAGSSGVAIGQMAEYASDAALAGEGLGSALASMAAVAGPIAAMALAIQGVSSILNAMKQGQAAQKAFDTEQVKQFTDAIEEGDQATQHYQDTLKKTGQVLADTGIKAGPAWTKILPGVDKLTESLGLWGKFGDKIEDILPKLNKAGISSQSWTDIVTAGADKQVGAMDALRSALDKTNLSDDERHDILIAARAAQDNYNNSVSTGTEMHKFFKDSVDTSNEALSTYLDFLYKQGAANRDAADAAHQEALERERNVNAAEQFKNKLAAVNVERDKVDAAAELRHERDAVDDVTDSYRRLHDEISNQESVLTLKRGFEDVEGAAIHAYDSAVKGAADAETLGNVPKQTTTAILALIDQQKYDAAQKAIENLTKPRQVDITFNPGGRFAPRAIGGVGGGRTLLGEEGPEFVDLPNGSRVIPAPITAAMMHQPSSAPMVVNVNMPRGSRGVDVLRQVSSQARRSGRRYGVPVVHYARR